jgi:hypothetical protein
MAGNADGAPIIIKKKKIVGGDGHHGGAWKVAMVQTFRFGHILRRCTSRHAAALQGRSDRGGRGSSPTRFVLADGVNTARRELTPG